ncbi:MAG: dihydropteroate synthase-like protein [Acidilobaceae archaeon]|nr:dihydropteroate synthase-like protein [Acidilobaceae archaeon]
MVRVALLTSRLAKEMLLEHLAGLGLKGIEVRVIDLPLHSISMVSAETIARVIKKRREIWERLREADLVLVPGSVAGDVSVISEELGRPVFKASRSLYYLGDVLKYVTEGGSLDTLRPAEEVMSLSEPKGEYVEAFSVGGLSVPLRGPPVIVASEAIARLGGEEFQEAVNRFLREGAKIVVVGSSFEMRPEELARRVAAVAERGVVAVVEAPSLQHAKAAVDAGAHGLAAAPEAVGEIAPYLSSQHFLVVGDRDVSALARAVRQAREVGINKLMVDPVVGVPLIDFALTAARYLEASELDLPLWFSAANAQEEIEADSHGVHALLAFLAVELRASVYAVVEDSPKSLHATAEAREALRVASQAFLAKTSPKGSFSRLLVIKRGSRRVAVKEEAESVGYVEPQWDEKGYLRVRVDHVRGEMVVSFLGRGGERAALRGRHATSLARAAVRRFGISAEHAAYLGYELAKAELALKLGIDYEQDEELLRTPWEES